MSVALFVGGTAISDRCREALWDEGLRAERVPSREALWARLGPEVGLVVLEASRSRALLACLQRLYTQYPRLETLLLCRDGEPEALWRLLSTLPFVGSDLRVVAVQGDPVEEVVEAARRARTRARTRKMVAAANQALRSEGPVAGVSARTLGRLLEEAPVGVALLEAGRVVAFNRAAERITGRAASRVLGAESERLFGVRLDDAGDGPWDFELAGLREPAQQVTAKTALVPQTFGGALRVVFFDDVTERRSLARRLQDAEKLESLGVLAGGVAHDFNNLLVGILGSADLVRFALPSDSPVQRDLKRIQSAAEQCAHLCRQLLAYAGKGQFVRELVQLGELAQDVGEVLAMSLPAEVRVDYALAPDAPPIEGDPGEVRQLVMNLITNAAEALGEDGGVIAVRTRPVDATRAYLDAHFRDAELRPGFYVALEVEDAGCGMAPETLARIFEPFFTTKFTGRGLGLAAAMGIVRHHRGGLSVQSELGVGTCFRLLLPVPVHGPVAEPAPR